MSFNKQEKLYKALREKAVSFAKASGFLEAKFLNVLGGMEKKTLRAQIKVKAAV
jgi:hypothetical protein